MSTTFEISRKQNCSKQANVKENFVKFSQVKKKLKMIIMIYFAAIKFLIAIYY